MPITVRELKEGKLRYPRICPIIIDVKTGDYGLCEMGADTHPKECVNCRVFKEMIE